MRSRDFALLLFAVATVYAPLSPFSPPDVQKFLAPWLEHIKAAGPILAFAHPFGNYSPPYLYLLALASALPIPALASIKLIAIGAAVWLAWCAGRLASALGAEPRAAAVLTLILPTVVLNAPLLGQCDALWTGFCVLALAAALEERPCRMALFAGCAFAFKAQAAFFAPLCIGYVLQRRAWTAFVIPPAAYLASIAPAALAGWPLPDLLTIYFRQAAYADFFPAGNAPNLWAFIQPLNIDPRLLFPFGYALAAGAAGGIVALRNRDPLDVALLSALLMPFLLPKMHERFFFLADILSAAIAFVRRDRFSVIVAALVQAGSTLSIVAYMAWPLGWPALDVAGAVFMAVAVAMSLRPIAPPRRLAAALPSM